MPFITFIYRVGRNPKTYFGKYVSDYISDDHEGLDDEVRRFLVNGINLYRKNKNLQKLNITINIGILSICLDNDIPNYSTNKEIKCFDFYYKEDDLSRYKIYINGKLIKK